MASSSKRPVGEIYPDVMYTVQELAIKTNMTPTHFRRKYIATGRCRVANLAKGSEMIPGYEFFRLCEEMLGCEAETDE